MKTYITSSKDQTIRLGSRLAKGLRQGQFIALIGELGSGKTTFVKGIAKGLGVKDYRYVNSPSFVIIKEYEGNIPLYHFDVFRLDREPAMNSIGYEEYFFGKGICVVEWADKIKNLLPKNYLEIKIDIIKDNRRKFTITDNR